MTKNLFSTKDKVVIVTGGLGQLGRQFTTALIQREAKVAVFDTAANENSRQLFPEKSDCSLMILKIDITRTDSIQKGLKQINEKWGIPDALINNAALDSPPNSSAEENGPFETYPPESWDKVMEINTKGVFLCCQAIGGQMAANNQGSIINICSIYGLVSPDQRIYDYRRKNNSAFYKPAAYSVSKSALLNLTRYLATYWADKNVRVNTLTLGGAYNRQDEIFLKGYCGRVPLGRMAKEDEYNGAVIFLISEASSYMTGSNLVIDGGWTAW